MKKVKSKITNKKAQKTKELKNTLKSITKSEDFKNIKSLISTINDSEIKTNQQRRESIAKIYLHCNDLFEESNLDKGRRAFLPHFHVLICGENKKTLEQFFTKYFPSNYEFMLNKDTSPINIIKNILLTT